MFFSIEKAKDAKTSSVKANVLKNYTRLYFMIKTIHSIQFCDCESNSDSNLQNHGFEKTLQLKF